MIRRCASLLLFTLLAACGSSSSTPSSSASSSSASGAGGAGGDASSSTTGTTAGTGGAPATDILAQLSAIPGLTVTEQGSRNAFYRYFVMGFDQPQDHERPAGEHFTQRLTLLYHDASAPVVLASTGYDINPSHPFVTEPARLLSANQILVEHRFFSASRPSPADWATLSIRQAAEDHHAIVAALKRLMPGSWISTGASKGGMTSVYHRRFYPDDVDGTIAYVAPQSYGNADPRYLTFLQEVGDPGCRAAVVAAAQEVLKRRPAMMQRLQADAAQNGDKYALLTADAALDYAAIELPFTFWQYYGASRCGSVPAATADDDAIWSFLADIDAPSFWDDASMTLYEPYYFQAAVELGYPGYDDGPLAPWLSVKKGSDVAATFVFPGPTKDVTFHPQAMTDIAAWLSTQGKNMLFIYGENDPYSAAAFDPKGAAQSARFFAPGGTHGSEIADLSPEDQQAAYQLIQRWTGIAPRPASSDRQERLHARRERPL